MTLTKGRAMRHLMLSIVLGCAAGIGLSPRTVHGQELALAAPIRGPRFLLASASKLLPVDVSTTPALVRRLSLELEGATLKQALAAITARSGLRLAYGDDVLPLEKRVHLRAEAITVAAALTDVLLDAGVDVVFKANGTAALVRRPSGVSVQTGAIVGRVTAKLAGLPMAGATIVVEGVSRYATSDDEGRYRIKDVPPGSYTVRVRSIGYLPASASAMVGADEEVTVDFALEKSAHPLQEVVTTGTLMPTEVKALPNPITVITEEQIQAKGSSKLEDLLRGEIPGVVALTLGNADAASYIFGRGNGNGFSFDVMQIYVDGVETADPVYIQTLDPASIERIEVVRGPAAAAIYGSGAASGVIQIFTKKGTLGLGRPRLQVEASTGLIESQDMGTPLSKGGRLSVTGGGESFSYNAGASYADAGQWVRNYGSKTVGLSGGARAVQGPLTVELTARWANRDFTYGMSPAYQRWPASEACPQCGNPNYVENAITETSDNLMALRLSYQATTNWAHTLRLGEDDISTVQFQPRPSFNTPADTLVSLSLGETSRRQLHYDMTYDAPLRGAVTARLTAGADYWAYANGGSVAYGLLQARNPTRTTEATSYFSSSDRWWNAGFFGLATLGFHDQLFLTLGARIEDNPNLGEDYGNAFVPRLGIAYTRPLGGMEVKIRGQWGKGIRPPPSIARVGENLPGGCCEITLPNPDIGPEEKVGWDAGVELHWSNRASFAITRFDEKARRNIDRVPVDLTATPAVYQFQNLSGTRIRGWELEGQLTLGRISLSANYAYLDNVIMELYGTEANSIWTVGDRAPYVPKHSAGGRITALVGRGSVSVDGSVVANQRALDFIAFYDWQYGGVPERPNFRDYWITQPAIWRWNLRAEQTLAARWQTFLRVENLTNDHASDVFNISVTPGRTTVLGMRFTY